MWRLLLLVLLSSACVTARAEDYYCCKPSGTKGSGVSTTDIASFGWADADCYPDPMTALAQMSGGDQLWFYDGTYVETGSVYWLTVSGVSGSSGDPTIIKALNAGAAVCSTTTGGGVRILDTSYVQLEGLHFQEIDPDNACVSVEGTSSHHVLVKRCSLAMDTMIATAGANLVTFEDCYGYGGPMRYTFQTSLGGSTTQQIIFRRCLVRWDWSNVNDPQACFANYSCTDVYYQNCIAIDCTDNKGYEMATFDGAKGFFNPNGGEGGYEGCIVMNGSGFGGFWFESSAANTVNNCLVWNLHYNAQDATDGYDPMSFVSSADTGALYVTNCTFGINDCVSCADPGAGGGTMSPISFDSDNVDEHIRNCIIYGMNLETGWYAYDGDADDEDYNLYYANDGGRNCNGGCGANDITDHDPLSYGLAEPPYISPCSYLQTAGEGGGKIGATIRTRIGVDGTFYGETGWNADTGVRLWPFPYQDEIRAKCAAFYMAAEEAYSVAAGDDYDSPVMDGARGFCAPGETLTSWILKGGE